MAEIFHHNKIKKVPLIGIFMCSMVVLLSGCSTLSTTTSAKNMTRPVMVGPVHYVKGDKKIPLYKKQDFDITVENSVVTTGGQYYQTTYVTNESSEKIDAELMRKIDSPQDKVIVDTLYLKSSRACFLVFCNARIDYSGIEGGIYSSAPLKTGSTK